MRKSFIIRLSRHEADIMTFRTALITGASRGIGAAIATRLAQDGYAVALNYASRGGEAEALAAGLREQGGRAIAVQGDVADAASAASLFDRVEAEWGGLDVLVNNAGVLQTVPLANASDTVFDQMMEVNVRGVFNTLRLAAQRLRAGGAIVNVSSTLVATNLPGYGIYVATKAAVEGFTRVLAKELRGRDITVNAVAPGPVATELFFTGKTPEQIATFTKAPPLERLGEPVDIANVVGFLAGPDGRWVHGQVVRANGGLA
ncbi:KR domain protein [Bordetella hinzii 4161]|nr:KR domain protein [Bordetella hinzii L60]KCB48905.1 KR domain protein [Bordetella hinzii 4161]